MRILIISLLLAHLLVACGQRGDLYLPEDAGSATSEEDDQVQSQKKPPKRPY